MKTDNSGIAPTIEALRSAKRATPMPLFRLKFPDELLMRIDAAVKLRGLKEEVTAELLRDIVIELMDDESQRDTKRSATRRLRTERDSSERHRV